VQIVPMNPQLKPPGTKILKLKHDEPLSNFAFNFKLRRYTEHCVFCRFMSDGNSYKAGMMGLGFELLRLGFRA